MWRHGRVLPTLSTVRAVSICQVNALVNQRQPPLHFGLGEVPVPRVRYRSGVHSRACAVRSRWHGGSSQGISLGRMRNNPIIVQKYGGACLETPAKIRAVASGLADLHSRGNRVVAIVSAMGKTTDELVKIAYQVSPHPNRRELDMLLTTGERISMSLMSMALSDLGVPAIDRILWMKTSP